MDEFLLFNSSSGSKGDDDDRRLWKSCLTGLCLVGFMTHFCFRRYQLMDAFALEILEDAKSWNWPIVKRIQKALFPNLLSCLIKESQAFGGTVLDQFWESVRKCDDRLKDNIENVTSVPPGQASAMLFAGVNREDINLNPIFEMAAEYFTHLAVVFLNPGGPQAGPSTPDSVNDIISMETNQLLALAIHGGLRTRKQEALKRLAFERDGTRCVMTGVKFSELPTDTNFTPILDHIIPNSIHGKPDTLECLAKFAGELARDLVLRYMTGIGNVANFQTDAHSWRNKLRWGIEAREEGGNVKYIYRRVPYSSDTGPAGISLRDGDEIRFGGGTKGVRLGKGPIPLLCNVQLAVARVLHMSGAAEAVMQLKQDSDDSDTPHAYVASDYFLEILDAKLLLQSIRV